MISQHTKHSRASTLVPLFFVAVILCSLLFSSCGSGDQSSPMYPFKPFLVLHVCLDNTYSFPLQFQQQAAKQIADGIDRYISPNMAGMFVDVAKIEINSIQDSFVTFSTPAIPDATKPQQGNDPYGYAKALSEWKKAVPSILAQVTAVRASITPYLDKMRSIHWQEVGGTDEIGCAASAADEFSKFPTGNKILLYVSDMQNNVDANFSKHINLYGAKVITIYHVCQVERACEQNTAYWASQFKAWNAQSYTTYSPAQSSAEHITGF